MHRRANFGKPARNGRGTQGHRLHSCYGHKIEEANEIRVFALILLAFSFIMMTTMQQSISVVKKTIAFSKLSPSDKITADGKNENESEFAKEEPAPAPSGAVQVPRR